MAKTMLFIDSRVNDLDLLVSQFDAGTEYQVLDAGHDGLLQMEESLAGKSEYSSIQIISHGSAGSITIGSTVLNENNLLQYQSQLNNIGHALSDNGDLLLYGCNVAAGMTGQQFVEALAQLTGADVAASDDVTGGVAAGGDWVLESATGPIESVVPLAEKDLQQYEHTLGYARDYVLAELSYVTYFINNETFSSNEQKAVDIWAAINNDWEIRRSDNHGDYAATAFRNGNTIVIAYRGTDSFIGTGDWLGANVAIANPSADWDYQFSEAIKFAEEVSKEYQDYNILVTGHSLGGALAQVVTKLFDKDGAAFDPGGAENIIWSSEYQQFIAFDTNGNLSNNIGPGSDFINYCVTNSLVSGASGGHIGPIEYLDAYGNTFIQAARTTVIASAAALNYWSYPVLRLLETYYLHSISGIVELMQAKADGTEDAVWQNGYDTNLTKAIDTGDVGLSGTSSDQGQIEFYSSAYNPYVFANNRDNIIYGSAGNDVIYSFAGNDTVYGGEGNDLISTAEGNDVIDGGGGSDTIYAGSGDDYIVVCEGAGDIIDAGSGNDTIEIGSVSGQFKVDGGSGFDKIDVDFSALPYNCSIVWWGDLNGVSGISFASSYKEIHDALSNGIDKLGLVFVPAIAISNIEQYSITGGGYPDLLLYSGGTRYAGGEAQFPGGGVDTFYADWSAATESIIWDNDPSKTITIQGAAISGVERLLIATGSGDDVILNIKVTTSDYIDTGAGNDVIEAGGGNDTIYAGSGDDQIIVDDGGDIINAGSGNDTIKISSVLCDGLNVDGGEGFDKVDADFSAYYNGWVCWRLDSASTIFRVGASFAELHDALANGQEKLSLTQEYSYFNIFNVEQYSLTATNGNDLLLYSGGSRYAGGEGTDTFYADWSDSTASIVWDNDPASTVTIQGAELSGLERLLIATGSGNDTIRNSKVTTSDYIDTGAGNDVIETVSGSDIIYAGSGNDQIVVSNGNSDFIDAGSGDDAITIGSVTAYANLSADGGTGFDKVDANFSTFDGRYYGGVCWRLDSADTIFRVGTSFAELNDALANGQEKLSLTQWYSYFNISNVEQYSLTATNGNDLLLYSGGSRYAGGEGTDTFYADWSDSTAAIVWDNDPASTVTIQGAELSGLERLLIATGSGNDTIRNSKVTTDDYISTGAGNDTIDTGGGSDTMIGGLGNDFYVVDSTGDIVTELASEGIDTVQSTISYILGENLENLILAGVSAINGTGNAAGNTLVGNSGNNSISGGEGDDTIYGGEGSDTAIFTGQFVDYVIDYNAGVSAYTVVDKIANRDGTDVISSVENFKFADGKKIMSSSIVDVVEPTVLSFTPYDGIGSVAIGSNIVLVFSEAIKSGVGTIAIHSGSATGPVVESYDTATSGNLTISGATLTINPTLDLANGTHYFVTLDAGSIKDIAGTDAYDFTTAATASLHDLNGSATFWKTGLPITAVTSTLVSGSVVAGTQPIEFRNIQTAADGSRTIEIWETSLTAGINSVLLETALPTGSTATWQDATGLPSGWNSSPNTDKPGQFILGGIGTTALSAGSVKLGTLTLTAPTNPQHFELSLTTGQLGNDTIPAFALSSDSMTTGTDGLYQHLAMNDGTYTLASAKVSGTAESNAIKANDALAALKIAVGMNPNADGSAVSPYQYLAADVNHDGQVKAADALNILKMAVKLSTAPEMEWLFVPESVGSESMSRTHVVWPDNPIPVTLDMDLDVNLIGIVKGDVDGSWAA